MHKIPYFVHKYFKKNKDQHEKNYYRKVTEENKWLKKLSQIKMYQHKKTNRTGKNFLRMEEDSMLIIEEIVRLIFRKNPTKPQKFLTVMYVKEILT